MKKINKNPLKLVIITFRKIKKKNKMLIQNKIKQSQKIQNKVTKFKIKNNNNKLENLYNFYIFIIFFH